MQYCQCFLCREWGWDASRCLDRVMLCLPCYVDVLEVRQARGELGNTAPKVDEVLREGPDQCEPPLPYAQLDMFLS